MNKYLSEIFIVFLDAAVKRADIFLLQETQDMFFQLPAPLARDDLDQRDLFFDRVLNDLIQAPVNVAAFVKDIVEIECELSQFFKVEILS